MTLTIAVLTACSSEEEKPPAPVDRSYVCIAAGGYCKVNAPYSCGPGYEPAIDTDRKDSCGKSVDSVPVDVPCCLPVPETDTGVPDTGMADATSDATSDAPSDAAAETTASDALLDISIDVNLDGG